MKKLILLIIISLGFASGGCFLKEKDLGQMLFPISIGLAYTDNKYSVYLQVLDTSTLSIVETESSSRDITFVLLHAENEDLGKALGDLGLKALTYISAIKLKSIVIHKSIFNESPIDFHDLTQYFINTSLFRSKVQLFVTDDDLEDFYSVQYMLVGASVYSHSNEEEPQIIRGFSNPSFLIDALKSNSENKRMYHFPIMNVNEENIDSGDSSGKISKVKSYRYEGVCFTTYNERVKFDCLNKEEALGYRWYSEVEFVNVAVNGSDNPINIIIEDVKWQNTILNDEFVINLTLKSFISINLSSYSLEEIKQRLEEEMKKAILNTLKVAYDKNIDIYHLNDYAYRKDKDIVYNPDNVRINFNISFVNSNYYKN